MTSGYLFLFLSCGSFKWLLDHSNNCLFVCPCMQFYSASYTDDLREVVHHVSCRYPKANLYALGWSLGANILVRYLGQVG